jgi:phosphoglycerate dehydrogenase-like enzyme
LAWIVSSAIILVGSIAGLTFCYFTAEPLPENSELWDLPVLISPHNMDQTTTFMHEATEFFLNENLPRFICGEDLLNPVDPALGY